MPLMIYSVDKPNGQSIRAEHMAAHLAFLERHKERLLASGGLYDEAGERYIGSCILLDVDTREQAQAFVNGDPFTKGGLAEKVVIQRWEGAYLDGKHTRAYVAKYPEGLK